MSALAQRVAALAVVWLLTAPAYGAPGQAEDARLKQPISIECVNGRLHTALERLSSISGVEIRCGKDDKDWQVRELPVLVCSKDLALGPLLYAIADATHLALTREERPDGAPAYRIWRDKSRAAYIEQTVEAEDNYRRDVHRYLIDMWASFKDIPESQYAEPPCCGRFLAEPIAKATSQVASSLSEEAKGWIMAGGTLKVMVPDCPESIQRDVREAFRARWQARNDAAIKRGQAPLRELKDADLDMAYFQFKTDYPAYGSILPSISSVLPGIDNVTRMPGSLAHGLKQDFKLPPPPESPPYVSGPPGYNKHYKSIYEPKLDCPMLKSKLKLTAPTGRRTTYSDAVSGIAAATGWAVVADDSGSHYLFRDLGAEDKLAKLYDREVTPTGILSLESWSSHTGWCVDQANRILMGGSLQWIKRQMSVTPESVVTKLQTALKSAEGLKLEDLAPVAALTHDQAEYWIWPNPDLKPLYESSGILATQSAWQAYFRLSPSLRQKAHTSAGVSLASVKPLTFEEIIARGEDDAVRLMRSDGSTVSEHPGDDWLCEPEALRSMKLRVTTGFDGRCTATVSGTVDGQKIETTGTLGPFPIRSK